MSSDRKDPGSTWQGPTTPPTTWNQKSDSVPEPEETSSPIDYSHAGTVQQGMAAPASTAPTSAEQQAAIQDADAPATTTFMPFELLKQFGQQFGQYIALIIVPLLFGGLTCLFVLPAIASRHASLPPDSFWPILLIIIAITIAQGVVVYYAGTDNGMWVLGTIGGLCLFLLVGCFAIYGPLPGVVLLIALVAGSIMLVRRSLHMVPNGFVDIAFSQKKYSRTLYPGINILLPWEQIHAQLNVEEVQWLCPAQVIQLSPDDDVMLRAVISYQLVQEDAHLAITQVRNWEESLRMLFTTTLQHVATVFKKEDFLPWAQLESATHTKEPGDDAFMGGFERRQAINSFLFRQIRDRVALWGIQVNWVSIRDINMEAHGAVVINPRPPVAQPASQPSQVQQAPVAAEEVVESASKRPAQETVTQAKTVQTDKAPKQTERPAPAPAPASATPRQLNEELLKQAYKEVQNGKVTDPETIRNIATRFEAVANDPEASQMVSFDAARAALNLYEQARRYEEQFTSYNDDTQHDWIVRRPTDENLMAGG